MRNSLLEIKIASDAEISYCYKIMHQIREDLSQNDLEKLINEQIKNGYKLAYVIENNEVICVAGFNIKNKISIGKYLQIDDFVTNKSLESSKAAKSLLSFIKTYAKKEKCDSLHLDSSVNRHDAHKFYLSEDMKIDSYHFSMEL